MGNKALWRKAIGDARLLLLFMTALLFGFNWLFVYLSSLIELGPLGVFLQTLPPAFEKLSACRSPAWPRRPGVSRRLTSIRSCCSQRRSGPSGVGRTRLVARSAAATMEMLLAQPVRRLSVLATQGAVTTIGSAILATAVLLGTCTGLATVSLGEHVDWRAFIPGALNLFAMMFFLSGVSTVLSSADNHRWRTIGLVGGFYVVQLVFKVIGRLVERFSWLMYLTFATACEPQALVIDADQAWALSMR